MAFEERALHLGWGAVYLICQYKVGEDRTFLHVELLVFLGIDHRTYHVGRQEVGSELDTTEVSVDELGKCFDGKCLCKSRYTFKQYVSVAEETYKQCIYKMFLTHDDLVHTRGQICYKRTLLFNANIQFANVNSFCHNSSIYSIRFQFWCKIT